MLAQANSLFMPLGEKSVHCAVMSPPYWSKRDYGLPPTEWPTVTYIPMAGLGAVTVQGCEVGCPHIWGDDDPFEPRKASQTNSPIQQGNRGTVMPDDAQSTRQLCLRCGGWRGTLGFEPDPTMYVAHLVAVFREVKRVLRDDGQCFVNIGDTRTADRQWQGIPQMLCFALQADGWRWEDEVVWSKPNPMPESQTNRFTRSHEMLYLFNKSRRAFFDGDAVREKLAGPLHAPGNKVGHDEGGHLRNDFGTERMTVTWGNPAGRTRRSVWTIPTEAYSGAHFATFPTALVRPCILAGTSARGVCPQCGAPWERVVARTDEIDTSPRGSRFDIGKTATHQQGRAQSGERYLSQTLGWRPTCDCGHEDTVPAVVLDPFCGSGTVGEVCRTLPNPRRFVGLDLSRPYLRDLALARSEYRTPAAALAELPLFEETML